MGSNASSPALALSQVAERVSGQERPGFREVASKLWRDEGLRGFTRGLQPRMLNVALWGSCMITCYEYLKRICAKS